MVQTEREIKIEIVQECHTFWYLNFILIKYIILIPTCFFLGTFPPVCCWLVVRNSTCHFNFEWFNSFGDKRFLITINGVIKKKLGIEKPGIGGRQNNKIILMNLKIFSDENEKWSCRNISIYQAQRPPARWKSWWILRNEWWSPRVVGNKNPTEASLMSWYLSFPTDWLAGCLAGW